MAVSAEVRRRARAIAKSWKEGTHSDSGNANLASVIVNTLTRTVAFTASGRFELEQYAAKLALSYSR